MTTQLRAALPVDLAGVLDVFLACWRTAYRGLLPQATLDAMTDRDAADLWAAALADAGSQVLVADDDGTVVGVVRWTPRDATVQSLYVHPGHQGHGTGAALLEAATRSVADAGGTRARLWVFAANTPARGFYEHHGWVPDGVTRVEDRFGAPELRLERTLEPTP
jgi:GNAT superfamily N-acetyltransferase